MTSTSPGTTFPGAPEGFSLRMPILSTLGLKGPRDPIKGSIRTLGRPRGRWFGHSQRQQRSSGLRKRHRFWHLGTPGHRKASSPHMHWRQPAAVMAMRQPRGQRRGWSGHRGKGLEGPPRKGGRPPKGLPKGLSKGLSKGLLSPRGPRFRGPGPKRPGPKGSGPKGSGRPMGPSSGSEQLQEKQSASTSLSMQPLRQGRRAGQNPGRSHWHLWHPSSPISKEQSLGHATAGHTRVPSSPQTHVGHPSAP